MGTRTGITNFAMIQSEGNLPFSGYCGWYLALEKNNVHKVIEFLEEASEVERHRLLNGTFDFKNTVCSLKKSNQNLQLSKPLFIAAAYGAYKVLKILITYGIDVMITDINGWNVLHSLVAVSFYDRGRSEIVCRVYKEMLSGLVSKIHVSMGYFNSFWEIYKCDKCVYIQACIETLEPCWPESGKWTLTKCLA